MRRSIFKAGVWTAFGLAVAFAIVSANSNPRHAATTVAPAAKATVATAANLADDCTSSDVCCARETKVKPAAVAAAPRAKQSTPVVSGPGAAGMVVGIDPETGELGMPNAEQIQELRGTQQPQAKTLATAVHFANGGVVQATELAPDYATLHIDATGKKIFGHSDNPTPNPAPATPALEEK